MKHPYEESYNQLTELQKAMLDDSFAKEIAKVENAKSKRELENIIREWENKKTMEVEGHHKKAAELQTASGKNTSVPTHLMDEYAYEAATIFKIDILLMKANSKLSNMTLPTPHETSPTPSDDLRTAVLKSNLKEERSISSAAIIGRRGTGTSDQKSSLAPPPPPQAKTGRSGSWEPSRPSMQGQTPKMNLHTQTTSVNPELANTVRQVSQLSDKEKSSIVAKPIGSKLSPTNQEEMAGIGSFVSRITERYSKNDYEGVAQEVALRILEMDRNMFLNMQKEKLSIATNNNITATNQPNVKSFQATPLEPINPQVMPDILKTKSVMKYYQNYSAQIAANSTNLQNFVVLSFNKMPLTQKIIMLKMWINVAERLKLNKDYEGLAQVVGALSSVLSGKPNGNLPEAEIHTDIVIDSKDKKILEEYNALFSDGRFRDIRQLMEKHISDKEQFIPMGSTITQDLDKFYGTYSMWVGYVEPLSKEEYERRVLLLKDPTKEKAYDKLVEERVKLITEKGGVEQVQEKLLKQQSHAQQGINKIDTLINNLPTQFIAKTESLFHKEVTVPLMEVEHITTTSIPSQGIRKGTGTNLPVDPLVEINNKISQSVKAKEFIETQISELKSDDKIKVKLKIQYLEVLQRLVDFEKDKLKLVNSHDFTTQEVSFKNQKQYLEQALSVAKDLINYEKSYGKDKVNLSNKLKSHSDLYMLFLDNRSAFNFQSSLADKNDAMRDRMIIDLNKGTNNILSKLTGPIAREIFDLSINTINNQITRINGYESFLSTQNPSGQLVESMHIDRQNLQVALDSLRLIDDYEKLMLLRKSVPPAITTEKFKEQISSIDKKISEVLQSYTVDLGGRAHKSIHTMAHMLRKISEECQAQLTNKTNSLDSSMHRSIKPEQPK